MIRYQPESCWWTGPLRRGHRSESCMPARVDHGFWKILTRSFSRRCICQSHLIGSFRLSLDSSRLRRNSFWRNRFDRTGNSGWSRHRIRLRPILECCRFWNCHWIWVFFPSKVILVLIWDWNSTNRKRIDSHLLYQKYLG